MIIGSVPLYNVMAVVVLSCFKPGRKGMERKLVIRTLKGIVTNPIILGILAGLLWSVLKLPCRKFWTKRFPTLEIWRRLWD